MAHRIDIPHYRLYGQSASKRSQWQFYSQRIATFVAAFGTYHHPHRHPDLYQLTWITAGRGEHTVDGQKYLLQPGGMYLLAPGVVHTCRSDGALDGFILHFTPEFLAPMTISVQPAMCEVAGFDGAERVRLTHLFESVHSEYAQEEVHKGTMLRALLSQILVLKNRQTQLEKHRPKSSAAAQLFQRFRDSVEVHFCQRRSLDFYAAALCVSKDHLRDAVRRSTGQSPRRIINDRLLLEARRLLIYSNATIAEISHQLGFRDANYFGKFFRKQAGRAPGQFRQWYRSTDG